MIPYGRIWHVSSRSGEAGCKLLYFVYFTLQKCGLLPDYLASGGEVPGDGEHGPPDGASDAEVVGQDGHHNAPDVTHRRAYSGIGGVIT